ncbi:flagellar biosynthetic protein FliR [Falsirhodobacter algicola]|uniref:Type III secretion protein n=1 Tax=Falsirhodobacter algicola TaxID=2692330 RepID=A0A8J8MSI3_9RHOB|nr:flagellar biosynthetic protein FliR [Falsirhodobacter algicola]QUS35925.1 type III secretion protein [Falsirhodobacter algicola]
MMPLYQTLAELTGLVTDGAPTVLAVFLRVGAIMALLPGFGEATVPMRIRLAVTLAFTAIAAPLVTVPPLGLGGYGGEVLVGLLLGMGLRLFVLALQTAASIAAQAASLSQLIGGAGEPQPALGHLLLSAGLALAMAAGLHLRVVELIVGSYAALPAGQIPAAADIAGWGVPQVAHAFSLGFQLALPFVAGALIYNIAIGVINRAMPQLMVTMIGAPALVLGAMALLLVAAPVILTLWLGQFHTWLANPYE